LSNEEEVRSVTSGVLLHSSGHLFSSNPFLETLSATPAASLAEKKPAAGLIEEFISLRRL